MSFFPYHIVLFDLDGTLLDTFDSVRASLEKGFAKQHIILPDGFDMKQLIGPPLREKVPTVLPVTKEDMDAIVEAERSELFLGEWKRVKVYPGIRKLLKTLKAHQIHTVVVTNKPENMTSFLLEKFHLRSYFDEVIAYHDEEPDIGKTEMIHKALQLYEGNAVMLGDRLYDILGACANHIDSIGIGYGYGSKDELMKAGATVYVKDTQELFSLLCGDCTPEPGFFLSVEGPDGSGKSTQLKLLKDKLIQYGFDLYCTREPGGCSISEKIRNILLDNANMNMCDPCEALLYAASRAQHVHEIIIPKLHEGKLVLSDRFVDSSVAYQGGARELGIQKVQAINAPAVESCMPDATLYFSISAEKALERRYSASSPDRLEMETLSFHQKVTKAYEEIIRNQPERFIVIDADRDIDTIAEDTLQAVLDRLDRQTAKEVESI